MIVRAGLALVCGIGWIVGVDLSLIRVLREQVYSSTGRPLVTRDSERPCCPLVNRDGSYPLPTIMKHGVPHHLVFTTMLYVLVFEGIPFAVFQNDARRWHV